jgi:hypothetical protein
MRKELIEKFETLITAAFGLVAALAWNAAIQKVFELYGGTQSTLPAMFIYAITVTIIAFLATSLLGRLSKRAKRRIDKRKKKAKR